MGRLGGNTATEPDTNSAMSCTVWDIRLYCSDGVGVDPRLDIQHNIAPIPSIGNNMQTTGRCSRAIQCWGPRIVPGFELPVSSARCVFIRMRIVVVL